jgi:hypothetical protein
LILFFSSYAFSQTLINLEKWTEDAASGIRVDTVSLFKNQYIDSYLEKIIQEANSKIATKEDSIIAFRYMVNVSKNYQQYQAKYSKISTTKNEVEGSDEDRLNLLKAMQKETEEALRAYPAFPRIGNFIIFIYTQYEQFYYKKEQWKNYIQFATNHLFFINPENKYGLFLSLGSMYNRLNEYKLASTAYDSAIGCIFNFYEDSLRQKNRKFENLIINCLSGRANCEEKLFLHDAALRSWEHALSLAADSTKKGIMSRIRRNKWDGGNLPAQEKYYAAQVQFSQNNLKEARTILQGVLPQLRTKAASDEVERTLSLVEYRLGYRYQALDRIWKIITDYQERQPDITATNDSVYNSYLQTYAQLCFSQGSFELLTLKRHGPAYIYLSKAAEINNINQRQSLFFLTFLLTGDKRDIIHIQKASEYGHRAWNFEEQNLPLPYKKALAQRLEWIYAQQGDFDEALHWRKAFLSVAN